MSNIIPNVFMTNLANNTLDFENHTIKAALFTGTFDATTLKDTDSYLNLTNPELDTTGYPTGGIEVTGKSVSTDNTTDMMKFDIEDLEFTAGTTDYDPVRFVVIYDDTDVNKGLVYIIDLTRDITITANGTLHITIHNDGIITCSNPTT